MATRLVVFSGPSGSGKSTIKDLLMKEFPTSFAFSVSRQYFYKTNLNYLRNQYLILLHKKMKLKMLNIEIKKKLLLTETGWIIVVRISE